MRSFPSSWSNTLSTLGLRRRRRRARRTATRWGRISALESLEERTLLAVATWDGGGANDNWTTAENWVGDVAPTAGDDLVFAGGTQTSTDNDFSTGTSFNSVTFASDDFTLAGNGITLADGVTVNSNVTGSAISLNVTVGASFTVDVVDTTLTMPGVLAGGNGVTKTGDGTFIVSGANS